MNRSNTEHVRFADRDCIYFSTWTPTFVARGQIQEIKYYTEKISWEVKNTKTLTNNTPLRSQVK